MLVVVIQAIFLVFVKCLLLRGEDILPSLSLTRRTAIYKRSTVNGCSCIYPHIYAT